MIAVLDGRFDVLYPADPQHPLVIYMEFKYSSINEQI
jgi:hypothetical protein